MKSLFVTIAMLVASVAASADTTGGYYKGDLNNDNEVNMVDVALLVDVLNEKADVTQPCYLDDDEDVDLEDLAVLTDMVLNKKEKVWVDLGPEIPSGGTNKTDDAPTVAQSKGMLGVSKK